MPTLHFKGFSHMDHYNGPGASFVKGDKKEVSDSVAAALLSSFPDAFEAVGSAPAKPAKTAAVKSPTKRRSAKKAGS